MMMDDENTEKKQSLQIYGSVFNIGPHILSQDSNYSVSAVLFTLFPPTYRQLVITVLCVSLFLFDAVAAVAAVIFRIVANRHFSPSQTQARIYLDADICAWLEHNYLQRFRLRVSSLVIFGTKYMIRQQIEWKKIFVRALWRWRTSYCLLDTVSKQCDVKWNDTYFLIVAHGKVNSWVLLKFGRFVALELESRSHGLFHNTHMLKSTHKCARHFVVFLLLAFDQNQVSSSGSMQNIREFLIYLGLLSYTIDQIDYSASVPKHDINQYWSNMCCTTEFFPHLPPLLLASVPCFETFKTILMVHQLNSMISNYRIGIFSIHPQNNHPKFCFINAKYKRLKRLCWTQKTHAYLPKTLKPFLRLLNSICTEKPMEHMCLRYKSSNACELNLFTWRNGFGKRRE